MQPDIDMTYRILYKQAQKGAQGKDQLTYGELSQAYKDWTDVWFEPHGTWDNTLGDINRRLDKAGLPPLSGLVITQSTAEPGAGFWGCCPRTSVPIPNDTAWKAAYAQILQDIRAATSTNKWPKILP